MNVMDGGSSVCLLLVVAVLALQCDICGGTVLSASSCSDLNKAIGRVNKDEKVGEVHIPKGANIRMGLCGGMTKIQKSISIVGLGSPAPTISGGKMYSLFYVSGKNTQLTLKNLVISSGSGVNGGCVRITKSNKGSFSNIAFRNCTSTKNGGAIYTEGVLSLTSVVFANNTSEMNGAAVWSWNRLSIRNSSFTRNSGINGSAIYSMSDVDIQNSKFFHNYFSTTRVCRGVLYLRQRSSIINVTFVDNGNPYKTDLNSDTWVSLKTIYHAGGAIWSSSTLIIEKSSFSENRATDGGALYLHGHCSIINSRFSNNESPYILDMSRITDLGEHQYAGGAIWSSGLLIIQNSFFTSNFDFLGGAIWNSGTLIIKNSGFSANSAYTAGDVYSNSSTSIQSSSFGKNSIVFGGVVSGASLHLAGPASIYNSSFTDITVSSGNSAYGGAIYSESVLNVSNSKFFKINLGAGYSTRGGGIYYSGKALQIKYSSFTNISIISGGESLGGGIYSSTPFDVSTLKFSNNEVLPAGANSKGKDYYIAK